jgi:carbon monoxide dehydrogenase subunit G
VVNASAVTIVGRSAWSGAVVDYTGEFWFPVQIDDFWQLIEDFDRYQQWWPWLQEFTTERAGLVAGNVLRVTVVPPVPYRVRLHVRFDSCRRLSLTEATIAGDLRGHASLSFDEVRGGTRVRATWTLEAASTPMRVAARVARPVVRWGHDRVVEMAVTGFSRRGLALGTG